jgi:hypothetical protein
MNQMETIGGDLQPHAPVGGGDPCGPDDAAGGTERA